MKCTKVFFPCKIVPANGHREDLGVYGCMKSEQWSIKCEFRGNRAIQNLKKGIHSWTLWPFKTHTRKGMKRQLIKSFLYARSESGNLKSRNIL